ncbi:MAG: hypothetical protein RXQ74_02835 [Caldivirga sp.]
MVVCRIRRLWCYGSCINTVWIIASIFFIFMVFPFAELGGLFPFSGSLARYNHYSHGVISNYLLAWAYTLSAIATLAVEAVAIVEYASYYVPQFWNSTLNVLTPLGLLVAAVLIAFFFIYSGDWCQYLWLV